MKNSYNDLTYNELINKKAELKREYRDVRFNLVVGHVENPLKKRTLRRTIARLNNIIYEYDQGIRKKQDK